VPTTYKLDWDDVFLDYDLSDDLIYHMMTKVEQDQAIVIENLTEQDVIVQWSEFAKDAFDPANPESSTPVDESHFLQFGIIMLSLAKLSRYRSQYAEKWTNVHDTMITDDVWEIIYNGPNSSEERQYYRSWFSILGHTDFCKPKIGSIVHTILAFHEVALILAYEEAVAKIKAGKRV
jgi:hypothetical protein